MSNEYFCFDCESQPCRCREKYASSGAIALVGLMFLVAWLLEASP